MWLTLIAVRNAIAVLMASLAIIVLGATSLKRLSIDLFPNINQPVITVGTIYTGANVQDIEKTVTYPVEKVVSAVAGVHHVESRSRQGISVVQAWFNYDADLNAGQNDIIQRIQQISNSLPSGIKQPFIIRADLSNIPVCLLTVSGAASTSDSSTTSPTTPSSRRSSGSTASPPPTWTAARSARSR